MVWQHFSGDSHAHLWYALYTEDRCPYGYRALCGALAVDEDEPPPAAGNSAVRCRECERRQVEMDALGRAAILDARPPAERRMRPP